LRSLLTNNVNGNDSIMAGRKYKYKRKSLFILLFDEDETLLYDCLFIYNNLDVGSLHIYNRLCFGGKCVVGFPICFSFTDTKCEEAIRSRLIELMQINPYLSSSELVKITGHSKSTITRHYMILKRKHGNRFNY
jgi:hypothetical protein